MVSKYDAIIIGAGPAGSSAAYHLSKAGLKVLLFEKYFFPREKVCGDTITPIGVALLEKMQLFNYLEIPPIKIRGVRIFTTRGGINQSQFKLNKNYPPYSLSIPRSYLDKALKEVAEDAGAEAREGAKVVSINFNESGLASGVSFESNGHTFTEKAHFIVMACGGGTKLGVQALGMRLDDYKAVGVAIRAYFENVSGVEDYMEIYAEDRYWPGMGWIFPLADSRVNAGIGYYLKDSLKRKASLNKSLSIFEKEGFYSGKRLVKAKMIGEPRAHKILMGGIKKKAFQKGIFLVGEAAGLVNPFTGEGIAPALKSGKWAAETIISACEKDLHTYEVLKTYQSKLNKEFYRYFTTGLILRKVASSNLITNTLVRVMNLNYKLGEFNLRFWIKGF